MNRLEKSQLFMEPTTTQYGSHMVMTNVIKPTKRTIINIDTKFRDEYGVPVTGNEDNTNLCSYSITIPERITNVKTMTVTNVELPISFYNISSSLGNNYFLVTDLNNNNAVKITVPDGQYNSPSDLISAINGQIQMNVLIDQIHFEYDNNQNKISLIIIGPQIIVDFTAEEKYNFKSKLGWLLGFTQLSYQKNHRATGGHIAQPIAIFYPTNLPNLNGPKYLYLAIDEHSKGNQNSFLTPIADAFINQRVIARLPMDYKIRPYGSVFPLNRAYGLKSDIRSYTGKIDLLKLNIQLLNENGAIMNLNGLDFSFCLEVEHE